MISGNATSGVFIGVNAAGTGALGNASGILISKSPNNLIGGTTSAEANLIAHNVRGVIVKDNWSTGNAIRGNAIFNNTAQGIDLNEDNVVKPNDAADPDGGPNNLQNFPVLNPILAPGTVTGSLDSAAGNTAYPVKLDQSARAEPGGASAGEGCLLNYLSLSLTQPESCDAHLRLSGFFVMGANGLCRSGQQ